MNRAYLLIGGNIGDRIMFLEKARLGIEECIGTIVSASTVYETASWGFSEADFLNQALEVFTEQSPDELLASISTIENNLLRVRQSEGYSSRTMDIDIIFYNNAVINAPPLLVIPHPRMHLRNFVLAPLAEICPLYIHPVFNKSIQALLDKSEDKSEVQKFIG